MATTSRARVLCVDEEPAVLEGLRLDLERRYELFATESGPAGLEAAGGPVGSSTARSADVLRIAAEFDWLETRAAPRKTSTPRTACCSRPAATS